MVADQCDNPANQVWLLCKAVVRPHRTRVAAQSAPRPVERHVAHPCRLLVSQVMTYIAYLHVAFQPLVVNNYFWADHKTQNPVLVTFIMVSGFARARWRRQPVRACVRNKACKIQ